MGEPKITIEEDEMPWTQTARDRKALEQEQQAGRKPDQPTDDQSTDDQSRDSEL